MSNSDTVFDTKVSTWCLGLITGLFTLVSLFGLGLLVCCIPVTTTVLAQATVDDEHSPYTHEQLAYSALLIRNLTIDGSSTVNADGLTNEDILFQTEGEFVSSLSNTVLVKYGISPSKMNSLSDTEEIGRYVGSIDTALGLDDDALSHLNDVNVVTSTALPVFFFAIPMCVLLTLVLAKKSRAALKWELRLAPLILVGLFVALALWGIVDFYGLFSVFHGILFPQGNWTFAMDSLLICSLPTGFWMGMGGVWLVCTLVACIICFILSWNIASKVE